MRKTRDIIRIDESKCDGCGQCITACEESALKLVDGKARLVGEVYCDGLGACIGACPQDALTIEQRESEPFDMQAVHELQARHKREQGSTPSSAPSGCPGAAMRALDASDQGQDDAPAAPTSRSQLGHWPVQLRLVSPSAPFLKGADLLICADCVPFAVPDLHSRYLAGRSVVVTCPKLDDIQEAEDKLAEIFTEARPKSATVLRMEVPCCGSLARAAQNAAERAGTEAPVDVRTIAIQGGGEMGQARQACPSMGREVVAP